MNLLFSFFFLLFQIFHTFFFFNEGRATIPPPQTYTANSNRFNQQKYSKFQQNDQRTKFEKSKEEKRKLLWGKKNVSFFSSKEKKE